MDATINVDMYKPFSVRQLSEARGCGVGGEDRIRGCGRTSWALQHILRFSFHFHFEKEAEDALPGISAATGSGGG